MKIIFIRQACAHSAQQPTISKRIMNIISFEVVWFSLCSRVRLSSVAVLYFIFLCVCTVCVVPSKMLREAAEYDGLLGAWKRVELNTNLLPMCMRFILFIIRVYCFYYNTHIHTHEYEWLSNVGLWIFCSTPRASLLLLFFCFFLFIYFLRVSRKYYSHRTGAFFYKFFAKKQSRPFQNYF